MEFSILNMNSIIIDQKSGKSLIFLSFIQNTYE